MPFIRRFGAAMADYYAVIKIRGTSLPQKLIFMAQGVGEAIKEMVRGAKVSSTSDLEEFEILEVVENGGGYIPRAAKLPRKGKGTLPITFPPIAPSLTTTEKVHQLTEKIYSSYEMLKG